MKRKLVALLLALTMVLSVAACGKKDSKDPSNGELVNGKFTTKRSITVEVYDRDGKTPADNNVWTDWIKKEMLELVGEGGI